MSEKNKCSENHTLRICGTANVGAKGQIVIPKEVRDSLGLEPGTSVSFILKDEKMLGIVPNTDIELLLEYIESEKNITLLQ